MDNLEYEIGFALIKAHTEVDEQGHKILVVEDFQLLEISPSPWKLTTKDLETYFSLVSQGYTPENELRNIMETRADADLKYYLESVKDEPEEEEE